MSKQNINKYNLVSFKKQILFKKIKRLVISKPLTSFFSLLGLLFLLIVVGSIMNRPQEELSASEQNKKEVSVYRIGSAPKINLQAKIEKSGVTKVIAQTAGIVQYINVNEGDYIERGMPIASLSSNYQGGDAMSLQRQLAQQQYQMVNGNFDAQKEIIQKQKEIAEKSLKNTDELRNISVKSVDESKSLLNLNNEILTTLDENLINLTASNPGGINNQTILQTKQLKAQLQAGNNHLQSALRQLEYQTNDDNPPTELAKLQKDITLKQLEIQEKSLGINREISRIQLNLAYINESFMHPASPFSGIVEKLHIQQGSYVSPGTPIATISSNNQNITAIVYVTDTIASSVSLLEPAILYLSGVNYPTGPRYVSNEPVNGQLYAIMYDIPEEYKQKVSNGGYINISVPVGYPDTGNTIPYIPIDAVFQTQNDTFVYVVNKDKALSRKVTLGNVYGRFVEITTGLKNGDQIINNRNVLDGDSIKITN